MLMHSPFNKHVLDVYFNTLPSKYGLHRWRSEFLLFWDMHLLDSFKTKEQSLDNWNMTHWVGHKGSLGYGAKSYRTSTFCATENLSFLVFHKEEITLTPIITLKTLNFKSSDGGNTAWVFVISPVAIYMSLVSGQYDWSKGRMTEVD